MISIVLRLFETGNIPLEPSLLLEVTLSVLITNCRQGCMICIAIFAIGGGLRRIIQREPYRGI